MRLITTVDPATCRCFSVSQRNENCNIEIPDVRVIGIECPDSGPFCCNARGYVKVSVNIRNVNFRVIWWNNCLLIHSSLDPSLLWRQRIWRLYMLLLKGWKWTRIGWEISLRAASWRWSFPTMTSLCPPLKTTNPTQRLLRIRRRPRYPLPPTPWPLTNRPLQPLKNRPQQHRNWPPLPQPHWNWPPLPQPQKNWPLQPLKKRNSKLLVKR